MDDLYDSTIRRGMKNWVAHYRPPVTGRQRLLKIAALPQEYQDRSAHWSGNDATSLAKIANQKPYEQAIEITHPWFWMLHLELSPLRHLA